MRATSPLCLQSYLQQLIQPLEKLSLSQEGGGRPDDVGGAKDEVSGPAILRDGEVHGVGGEVRSTERGPRPHRRVGNKSGAWKGDQAGPGWLAQRPACSARRR